MKGLYCREMLKSKIYYATITGCDLYYEGSLSIDEEIMQKAEILPGEMIHVLNVENGSRIVTYAIPAPSKSGTFLLNGPAAREGMPGDRVVILCYCTVLESDAKTFKPIKINLDKNNKITIIN